MLKKAKNKAKKINVKAKVKSAKCLCLPPVVLGLVLVLRIWSCLHITQSCLVRNLGVSLDEELTLTTHVNLLVGRCYGQADSCGASGADDEP